MYVKNKKTFGRLAIATVIATFVLIIVGGIVRSSGSGLGCPDWPLCQGQIVPQLQGTTLVEFSHRIVSTIVTILILATALFAWRNYRDEKWIVGPAFLAVVLLAIQIVLGGVTVLLELPAIVVAAHLGNALLLFAMVITAATFALRPWGETRPRDTLRRSSYRHWALTSLIGTFILIISGTVVLGTNAQYTCPTWPLCRDQIVPLDILPFIAATHRYVAVAVGMMTLGVFVRTWRTRWNNVLLRNASIIAMELFLLQGAIGALNALWNFPVEMSTLHLVGTGAVWASMVVFTILAYQTGDIQVEEATDADNPRPITPNTAHPVSSFLQLVKPWIVALLLTTTLGGMLIAQSGFPSLALIFFTLLGGALTSAGANALNSYIDRDIDPLMTRTARRPIPSGRITPRQALVFGFGASTTGVFVLGIFVNWLSAALASIGFFYYVVIYTLLLKRSTPQNVVIGGGAGAIPPMVGWAAVTGRIDLLAIFLFLIIFHWTPPHTWALMLMLTKEYERANIPMMPVAKGEQSTRRQIVLYSLAMIAVTLNPFFFHELGIGYLIAALALGGWFLYLAVKLMREPSKPMARRLYRYSNYYLALLFLAMVIDKSFLHF